VLFFKQKGGGTSAEGVSIEAPRERGVGRGQIPSSEIFFHFGTPKSLLLLHFECYFVSSCTTDGLLWDDLSGSIAERNRENPQDPNGRSCFLTCHSTNLVLFLISSFNPPLLPWRPTP